MALGEYLNVIAKFSRTRKNRSLKPAFFTIDGLLHAINTMAIHLQPVYPVNACLLKINTFGNLLGYFFHWILVHSPLMKSKMTLKSYLLRRHPN
jgi:hypothetical protein